MLFIIYHAMSCHACSLSNYLTKFNLHNDFVLGLYDCEMGKPPFIEGCCARVVVLFGFGRFGLGYSRCRCQEALGGGG